MSKNFMTSLCLIAEYYCIVYIYHIFCIHSSIEGHLGSFHLLATTNRAALNIVENVSLLNAEESAGYMPRSGIVGSSGSIIPNFLTRRRKEWSPVPEMLNAAVWGNTRTGKWEGVDWGTGGGRGFMGLSGRWDPGKGKSFEM